MEIPPNYHPQIRFYDIANRCIGNTIWRTARFRRRSNCSKLHQCCWCNLCNYHFTFMQHVRDSMKSRAIEFSLLTWFAYHALMQIKFSSKITAFHSIYVFFTCHQTQKLASSLLLWNSWSDHYTITVSWTKMLIHWKIIRCLGGRDAQNLNEVRRTNLLFATCFQVRWWLTQIKMINHETSVV